MLRAHDIVGTSISLAGNDGNLGHSSLSIGVQELSSVTNDTVVLLGGSGQETGNIDQGENWDVEGIGETDKAGSLDRGVDVKHTGRHQGLVGNDGDGASAHAAETNDNVLGIVGHDLKELRVINKTGNNILDVVGLGRIHGNNLVQRGILAVRGIISVTDRGLLLVGEGQKVDKVAETLKCLDVVLESVVGNTRLDSVGLGTSELLLGDLLLGNSLYDLGSSHEKVRGITDHESEVGQSGRVDGTTGARSHDEGDLGNNTRRHDVFLQVAIRTEDVSLVSSSTFLG